MKNLIILFLLFSSYLFAFENVNAKNLDSMIKDKKVILDFYASWCPPCKIISKHLNIYNKTNSDDVHIFKVNIDEHRDLMQRFDIKSIPTLVYLKDGKPIFKEVGIRNNSEIRSNVNKYLH